MSTTHFSDLGGSAYRDPLDKDLHTEIPWTGIPQATWDQTARQELTSYRDPLWTEWLTDRCKNITLPQTSFAGGKKLHQIKYTKLLLSTICRTVSEMLGIYGLN